MISRRTAAVVGVLALAFSGCRDSTGPSVSVPATMVKMGDPATGTMVGATVEDSLAVRLLDSKGNPVRGVEVTWTVAAGGGSISPATSMTDTDGRARAAWRLGTRAGENRATARAAELPPVTFTATGVAGPPANLAKLSGDDQTTTVRGALSAPLVVRVTDAHGNLVSGAGVNWTVAAGGGALAPASASTDTTGEARATWTLGPSAGVNAASAAVSGVPAAEFQATGTAGAAARLVKVAGDTQQAIAGGRAPEPLTVRVTDAYGNPTAGVPVSWSVRSGGGSVAPFGTVTDTAGEVRANWTLGSVAGGNSVSASVSGAPAVDFSATAVAGAAARLVKVAGDAQQATVGGAAREPLVVRVTDSERNPIGGATVSWSVLSGAGSIAPATATTNTAGEVRATWTLGTAAGANTASATVADVPAERFSAQGTPGAVTSLAVVSGGEQAAALSTLLPNALAVRATDRYGNPVPSAPVTWTVKTNGGGQFASAMTSTGAEGTARASWKLGEVPGIHSATVAVGGTTATFSAIADPPRGQTIALNPPQIVGDSVFPDGNTPQGGQGQPTASGMACIEMVEYHAHAHVSLFVDGRQIALPAGMGIVDPVRAPNGSVFGSCYYWLHTHDASGIVHVEPPTTVRLTLGQLFEVWGGPLSDTEVANFEGPVTIYVDGVRYEGDPRAIQFNKHREITMFVGSVFAPIPQYTWPTGL